MLLIELEKEHFEIVKILLDALLLAIYLGYMTIANTILNHPIYRIFAGGSLDPIDPQAYDDSQFSSDINKFFID